MRNSILSLALLAGVALTAFTPAHDAEAASLSQLRELLAPAEAKADAIGNTPWEKVVYVSAASTATSSASGASYASAKNWADQDLFAIPANVVVEQVYAVVDEAISGLTAVSIGDDDAATGFVTSASSPLASLGVNWYEQTDKGSYLKIGANARAKFYSATGKEVKLDVTGTASAGKARFYFRGFSFGKP